MGTSAPIAYRGTEKRRCDRLGRELAVIYRFDQGGRRIEDACRCVDLGERGLALFSPRPIELNTKLFLKLLIGKRIVRLEGRVVYLRPGPDENRVGVEFEGTATQDPMFGSLLSAEFSQVRG